MTTSLIIKASETEIEMNEYLKQLSVEFGFKLVTKSDSPLQLIWQDGQLQLFQIEQKNQGGVRVDFCSSQSEYRRNQASIKKEVIARAVGIKANYRPNVLDATAGLGRDGFVLAALGCNVTWLERHPCVAALLFDGLYRAQQDPNIGDWVSQRLKLIHSSALTSEDILPQLAQKPDVVYLDPMYPHKKKSAAVKKEMKVFQSLVGADLDADGLLASARKMAVKRVVVKRPDYAKPLNGEKPNFTIDSKKHRFDIYLINE